MVSNIVEGMYGKASRINPETLTTEAKLFMKAFREDIRIHTSIHKNMGNLVARTLIKYHNDTGEHLAPLLVELITVSYHVIDGYRQYAIKVTEFLMLSGIFAALTITDDGDEVRDIIEQLMVGIMTNPIFEFDADEREQIIKLCYQVKSYIRMLDQFSGKFGDMLELVNASVDSGMIQALEICNATAEEVGRLQSGKGFWLERMIGRSKFFAYLCWPMFNISSSSILRWFNQRTGIEIWPVE